MNKDIKTQITIDLVYDLRNRLWIIWDYLYELYPDGTPPDFDVLDFDVDSMVYCLKERMTQ